MSESVLFSILLTLVFCKNRFTNSVSYQEARYPQAAGCILLRFSFRLVTIGTKRMEAGERRWYTPKCNGRPYNPAFYLCCSGYLARKTGSRPACCGRYSYNASFYLCCSGHIARKTGSRPACCGRYSYNASFYLCCSGHIARKTGSRPACCGTISYNATFYLCCSGKLKRKSGWNPTC